MYSLRILSVLLALFVVGCANPGQVDKDLQPAWLLGESEDFPRSRFLLGVGEADDLASAKSRARAELAKIFSVHIDSETRESSRFERSISSASDDSSKRYERIEVAQELNTNTVKLLEGVDIADVWRDPKSGRHYALATLPRMKTAMFLRTRIQELDNATQKLIAATPETASLLQKIRQASEAIALQQLRRDLNSQLRIVSVVGQGIEANWSVEELAADRGRMLADVTIVPEARGDQKNQLAPALADALANQGMTVSRDGRYRLIATLRSVPLPPRNGWYFHNANLSISLLEEGGENLGGYEWRYKASATDPALAEVRVMADAKDYLNKELTQRLFDILEPSDSGR